MIHGTAPTWEWGDEVHYEGNCCGMATNGGLWLVHPTMRGKRFMEAWVALMFKVH
jgi:hypothetical protein